MSGTRMVNSHLGMGRSKFWNGDYSAAREELILALEEGAAEAGLFLFLLWQEGNGAGISEEQAVEWLRAAAQDGNARAQRELAAKLFAWGKGRQEEFSEAIEWYERAAAQGDVPATCHLGIIFVQGQAGYLDREKGIALLRDSASMGFYPAMYHLARCHDGSVEGFSVNDEEAAKWYSLAADQGHPTAAEWIEANGLTVYGRLAEEGSVDAMYRLGGLYARGVGGKPDSAKALKWYKKAAEGGNRPAMVYLSILYGAGVGVGRNEHEAERWMDEALA